MANSNNQAKKKRTFESSFEKARQTGKRIKKVTVGGITHETWEQPDGRTWIFAYYNENHVVKTAKSAENSKRLAKRIEI